MNGVVSSNESMNWMIESLMKIQSSEKMLSKVRSPYHTVAMDFILALPTVPAVSP